jgi:hypothetical protein
MRLRTLMIAMGSVTVIVLNGARTSAAPLPLSDPMCPRAVPQLVAFNDAGRSNDLGRIAQAAHAAAEVYQACAADAQSRTGRFLSAEPFLNYEKTRAAQFLVVEGRALIASGNLSAGIDVMKEARRLADYVANWQPESVAWDVTNRAGFTNDAPVVFHGSAANRISTATDDTGTGDGGRMNIHTPISGNTAQHNPDRQGSRYQTAALEIEQAAAEVLTRIQALHLTSQPAQVQ